MLLLCVVLDVSDLIILFLFPWCTYLKPFLTSNFLLQFIFLTTLKFIHLHIIYQKHSFIFYHAVKKTSSHNNVIIIQFLK